MYIHSKASAFFVFFRLGKRVKLNIFDRFLEKNAAKDRKRAKYGDRSLKKAFR